MGKSFRRNNEYGRKYADARKSRAVKHRENNSNKSFRQNDQIDHYEYDIVHGRNVNK